MEPILVGALSIVGFLLLLALGVHIAFCFLVAGFVGATILVGWNAALGFLGQNMYHTISNPVMCCLPLFVLLGALAQTGGFAEKAYAAMYKLTRGLPGALGVATSFSCAAFGAVSGSSLATAAVFGRLVLPQMKKYNYKRSFALGTIAASGTFASMIPPSGMFIIYAIFTDTSIGRLFMAGIIPGLMTAVVYSLSIIVRVWRSPELAPMVAREPLTYRQRFLALGQLWQIGLVAIIVLGGIYTGVFSPTEAAAAGIMAILILGFLLKTIRRVGDVRGSLRESAQTTAMVFAIIVGAFYFARTLALTEVPFWLAGLVVGWDVPGIVVLLGILGVFFILGMLIVPSGFFAFMLPIVFPVIVKLGYDPIWFGVMSLKFSEIGAVSPPVGLNCYTLKAVAGEGTSIEEVFAGVWPFIACDLVVVLLLIVFPQIALFLPNLMMGK